MKIALKVLVRRWLWLTLSAAAAFAVLVWLDMRLKAATGAGVAALQSADTALAFKMVFSAWIARQHAAMAGFWLGFDYLFMPLYGFAFYYSAILAREAFAPKRGTPRRLLDALALVPLIGVAADAVENALEFAMLSATATDLMAVAAYRATQLKWICFGIGVGLLLAAVAGVLKLRQSKSQEP